MWRASFVGLNGGGLQKRGRDGRGVWGEFRHARAFRRSEAEAGQFPSKWFRAKFRISQEFFMKSQSHLRPIF